MWEVIKEIFLTERPCFTDYKRHSSYHRGRSLLRTHPEVFESSPQSLDADSAVSFLEIEGKDLHVCPTKNWIVRYIESKQYYLFTSCNINRYL